MDIKYIVLLAGAIFCLLTSFAGLSVVSRKGQSLRQSALAVTILYIIFSAAVLGSLLFYNRFYDFITGLNSFGYLAPLGAGLFLLLRCWLDKFSKTFVVLTVLSVAGILYFFPDYQIRFYPGLPQWLNQVFILLLWMVAAFSLRFLNGINGLPAVEVCTITTGIFFISLIGGVPFMLGLNSGFLMFCSLAFLAYTWYPAPVEVTNKSLDVLGYLLAWLMVIGSAEGSGSSIFIFAAFWITEMAVAWLKRATFLKKYHNVTANTNYYQANISGLNPGVICNYVIRLNILLILFGAFQLFAPNSVSVPLFCLVICLWNLYRLRNWQQEPKNLKEINQQFASEFKSGLEKVKSNLTSKE